MKTLATTLALCFSVLVGFANHTFSKLKLKMHDNSAFTVVFNNKTFNQPTRHFNLNQLNPGHHNITIFKKIFRHNHHSEKVIIYDGFIQVPAGTEVTAIIDCHNNLDILSLQPLYYTNSNIYNNGWGGFSNTPTYANAYTPINACVNFNPAPMCMNSQSLNALIYTINNTAFDSNKLQIAIQAISHNGASSSQVLTLMNLLTFESNKVSFAKQAYPFTVDKGNYYLVNNGFTFSSSIGELTNYINRF